MFQASAWLLSRATEIHWSSISYPGWRGTPLPPSNGREIYADSFEIMIPLLPGCRNLTSIVLAGVIVSGEHQHAIYSLPHLRTITLRSAHFQNTAVKMPKHNVTDLRTINIHSEAALSHILHQTSSALVTLLVDEELTNLFSLDTPRCPHLTTFTLNSSVHQSLPRETITFLERHSNIRVIHLNAIPTCQVLWAGLLPKLTRMTACGEWGRAFLARPELTEFYQHPEDRPWIVRHLWEWLEQVQLSQLHPPRLEQMRIAIFRHSTLLGALPVISHVFGSSLIKLHLSIAPYHGSTCSPIDLLGGWTRLKGPGPYSGSQSTVEFARLRSIRVSFPIEMETKFPRTACQKLFAQKILPLCPVLEEALFTVISSYKEIEREEPEGGMELQIVKKGCNWCLQDGKDLDLQALRV
jgi:hypothetical protein